MVERWWNGGKEERMNKAVLAMLGRYPLKTADDQKRALLEVIQEIVLLGLYQGGFFAVASFYGGSALRILYDLDRFSEDLDFTLLTQNSNFDLSPYFFFIQQSLEAFGFNMELQRKEKSIETPIQSAFLKGNTLQHLMNINPGNDKVAGFSHNDHLTIKIEVDTAPPDGALTEIRYLLNPMPFSVNSYTLPSLFAGKIHAILCRSWKIRVKGRDFYDYLWFLSRHVPVNLYHTELRLRQNKFWIQDNSITKEQLVHLLIAKFKEVDFEQAKKDIRPFISDTYDLSLWSADFFIQLTNEKMKAE
jgi:predicted nucleotidyltransferase component of viral defense system